MIGLLRSLGIIGLIGALVVGAIAASMPVRDPAVLAGSWILANLPLIGAWLTVVLMLVLALVCFRAARRLHGLAIDAEDRRLRDDPRFTEAWVEQLKRERASETPAPSEGMSGASGDPPQNP